MRAIDTNVVVRFLTNDDKRQAKAARGLSHSNDPRSVSGSLGRPEKRFLDVGFG